MGQINWTAESERWLRYIHDYITNDNSRADTRVVDAIYERVQILRQFRELGYKYGRNSALNIRICSTDTIELPISLKLMAT